MLRIEEFAQISAKARGQGEAVRAADGTLTYAQLDVLANRLARSLVACGVNQGDRVGLWQEKGVQTVAAMQAILRVGAAYVPLDPASPAPRAAAILRDCRVAALVTDDRRARQVLDGELTGLPCIGPTLPGATAWSTVYETSPEPLPSRGGGDDDLAYILYTSGSTGTPKGVCLTHRNALAFVEWAQAELSATSDDRFANHAPFHFDLSVLDLYVAFASGACVSIIPESQSYLARRLVDFVRTERTTVWYSVPSALQLMMDEGGFLQTENLTLRAILFAGEPFPIPALARLRNHFKDVRLLNLYGPTETNVCTFHEVHEVPTAPIPIGRACCGNRVFALTEDGRTADVGEEGELYVDGPTVMSGYFGQPQRPLGPYATGDRVRRLPDDSWAYLGRLDAMLKVRGYRVEPGEIEAVLAKHPSVRQAAVVASGSGLSARLIAFIVPVEGAEPTLLELKRQCAQHLPRQMIIDDFQICPALPRTANGKLDRRSLAVSAAS